MRKQRVHAPDFNPKTDKIGGPRKMRCTHCRSEYAVPVRNQKKLVYECPKCHTQYTFTAVK